MTTPARGSSLPTSNMCTRCGGYVARPDPLCPACVRAVRDRCEAATRRLWRAVYRCPRCGWKEYR